MNSALLSTETGRTTPLGGNLATGLDINNTEKSQPGIDPVRINLMQPSFPAANNASSYKKIAQDLFDMGVANHVTLSEILRATDCRLTEILFLCGVYPENAWVRYATQLSFAKKLKYSKQILPQSVLPITLIRSMSEIRNLAEHQFDEPESEKLRQALETMSVFFEVTKDHCEILGYFSMFKYPVDGIDAGVVIQIMRVNGTILLIHDGAKPDSLMGISAQSSLGQSLIGKILNDIKWYLNNEPNFKYRLGFI